MIVWHVTSIGKFKKYLQEGIIKPPVRAWETIKEAERFSKQTGRQIILRLKFPKAVERLEGHKDLALVSKKPYSIENWLFPHKNQKRRMRNNEN